MRYCFAGYVRIFVCLAAPLLVSFILAQERPKPDPVAPGPPPDNPALDRRMQPAPPPLVPGPRAMRRADRLPRAAVRMAEGRGGRMGEGLAALLRSPRLRKELGITEEQRRKLEDIRFNTTRAAIQQRATLQVLRLDLDRLKQADAPDRAAIDKEIQEIAQAGAALMRTRVGAELDVRAVLTKEQRDKLSEGARGFLMQRSWMPDREGEGPMPPPPARDRGTPLPKPPLPPDK
jgi:Spy/CpxP family protein refolding chaperone